MCAAELQIHEARKAALELLLSDHLGDCMGPCQVICPAHMEIPLMIRQIAGGRLDEAIDTVKRDIALPAVLGRICPAPCEASCTLSINESPVLIRNIELQIVERGWAEGHIRPQPAKDKTHKRVAVIGSGPAGLAAAQQLVAGLQRHAGEAFSHIPERGVFQFLGPDEPGDAVETLLGVTTGSVLGTLGKE